MIMENDKVTDCTAHIVTFVVSLFNLIFFITMIELGCGDRVVTFLNFKAYLARLSVDENCKLDYTTIVQCPVQVTIEPSRSSSMKHLKDGLCNGLGKQSRELPFESESLEKFKRLFPIGSLEQNEKIIFTKRNDELCLKARNKECGCVKDKWLATAFMNLYFNEKHTVVPKAQQMAKAKYSDLQANVVSK